MSSDLQQVQAFIDAYPASPLRPAAEALLGMLVRRGAQAAPTPAATPSPSPVGQRPDETAWTFVQMSTDIRQVQAFIEMYPASPLRSKAEALRETLMNRQVAAVPSP